MEPVPFAITSFMKKKPRSEQPRRRRSQIAPFVFQNQTTHLSFDSGFSCNFDADEDDVSCDSNIAVSNLKKRKFDEIKCSRSITRSNYNKETEAKINEAAEVSESSCVESNSAADFLVFGGRSSKLRKTSENIEKTEKSDAVSVSHGVAPARSGMSGVISKLSSESKENDVVSVTSKIDNEINENVNDIVEANFTVSNSDSAVDQKPNNFVDLDTSHLFCDEELSLEEILSDSSSSHKSVFSELQSDIFAETSDLDFSDYTPSLSYDTGSQFSEKSTNESSVSVTRSLYLEFKQQFCRSSSLLDPKFAPSAEDERQINSTLVKFENEDDEESYTRLRERERRQVYLRDYSEEYGDLILQQRSIVVPWMVEECTAKEFQHETIFLAVNLLDRFLSKGFFINKRNLQIVGIACLALAVRIEENQPYNSVRQRNFYMGTNTYSRNEVVAMEWLVMEVLDFQCFLPTIYNFLWFYLKAAKANAEVERRAKYLAVLALSDHEQLRYWPSTVAAGVVIMACTDSIEHELYSQVIEIHMKTDADNDLPECMKLGLVGTLYKVAYKGISTSFSLADYHSFLLHHIERWVARLQRSRTKPPSPPNNKIRV